jgi:Cu2+-containing amine oxidase
MKSAAQGPLDPLGEGELASAVAILRAEKKLDGEVALVSLELDEPAKGTSATHAIDGAADRAAFAVLHDRAANQTFEAHIDLDRRRLSSWKEIQGVEPMMTSEDFTLAERIVRADERWRAAMEKRGIEDLERVYVDVWSPGELTPRDPRGVRLVRAIANLKGRQKNSYGAPIEGVVATIDLTHERVVDVVDSGPVTLSRTSTDFFDPDVRGADRAAPGDLRLAHPRATAIAVDGHEIRWQNWRLRWSMNPREGLVLHEIGFEDRGRLRSILYRASIAEMWVPYGDPVANWTWRNAFDEGEYGLGSMANTLVLGRDVPENALLFDAPFANSGGEVSSQPAVVAAYERDGGLLWSHKDDSAGTEARRATELVVGFVATAGNYDYGFRWVFHQDGTIAFEMDLTGILLVKGVEETLCRVCRTDPSDAFAQRAPGSPIDPASAVAPAAPIDDRSPGAPVVPIDDRSLNAQVSPIDARSRDAQAAPIDARSPSARIARIDARSRGAQAEPIDPSAVLVPEGDEAYGTLVADHVVATNHQHFVSLRLDFDVDGTKNRVKEWNVRSESADPENRGFVVEQRLLRKESEARRDASSAEHRAWEVYNPASQNATGHAAGYAIVPQESAFSYLGAKSRERELAGFVEHAFWVTRFREGERYAAGDYPSQGGAPGGLPAWSSDDESIDDADVVVWYTLGITHVPRPEDYPVMPVEHAGVKLVPHGFFDRNPALDVH